MPTFTLGKKQERKFSEWKSNHNKTCEFYDDGSKASSPMGAIGGRFTYKFTPTGLGIIIEIECACSGKVDLTEDF